MKSARFHSLSMEELSLALRLGCSEAERAKPQEVRFHIELRFSSPLLACQSDDLRDTLCYGELADALRKHFGASEFHLLERVAEEAYGIVKEMALKLGAGTEVAVLARKVRPPVEGLLGGSCYRVGDFPA